jgi:anti-sigma regulatory factor (Ser/Thr protein kinase)
MIVLETLDTNTGTAELLLVSGEWDTAGDELEGLVGMATQLGLRVLRMRSASGRVCTRVLVEPDPVAGEARRAELPSHSPHGDMAAPSSRQNPAPMTVEELPGLVHRYTGKGGAPSYEVTFEHRPESLRAISLYAGLVLEAWVPAATANAHLRLAIYELCANIIDHGTPRRPEPVLKIALRFDGRQVHGWIQDCCERFDPSTARVASLEELVAARSRRGYGIRIVRQLLDSYRHRFNETGNKLMFRKGVVS